MISNIIAGIACLISAITVLVSWYYNHKSHLQYFESLKPLLSFKLTTCNNLLMLSVINTGQSEANSIKMDFEEIKGNGLSDNFRLSDIFTSELTLYPKEEISAHIACSGEAINAAFAPMVCIHVSYVEGNTQREVNYQRWVSYSEDKISSTTNTDSIEAILTEIAVSENRIANYLEGRWLTRQDEINSPPQSSLYKDIKRAVNNIGQTDEGCM